MYFVYRVHIHAYRCALSGGRIKMYMIILILSSIAPFESVSFLCSLVQIMNSRWRPVERQAHHNWKSFLLFISLVVGLLGENM